MNRVLVDDLTRDPLGVVIPAYNEGAWVRRAVTAVHQSARIAGWPLDVVVVDDGSTDTQSQIALREVAAEAGVRVIRQSNRGRFEARLAGLRALSTDFVLLLDSRVEIDPTALERLSAEVEGTDTEVWNLDVTPGSRDPRALFWVGITKVWWRAYFADRRRVAFGPEDFDRYPKGTGAFFAPRWLLLDAAQDFTSLFARPELASDDTRLLREVARRRLINLSPEITSRHYVKSGWHSWARQCYYRGTTFVDSYLGDARRALPLLAAVGALSIGAIPLTLRMPKVAGGLILGGAFATATGVRRAGGTAAESMAVAGLMPPFGVFFGAGVVRGLWFAARQR